MGGGHDRGTPTSALPFARHTERPARLRGAAQARRAIKKAKYRISADRKVVELRLANKPGTLARAAKRLGKAKVNIESAYMLGQGKKSSTLALGVKNARAANKALGRR